MWFYIPGSQKYNREYLVLKTIRNTGIILLLCLPTSPSLAAPHRFKKAIPAVEAPKSPSLLYMYTTENEIAFINTESAKYDSEIDIGWVVQTSFLKHASSASPTMMAIYTTSSIMINCKANTWSIPMRIYTDVNGKTEVLPTSAEETVRKSIPKDSIISMVTDGVCAARWDSDPSHYFHSYDDARAAANKQFAYIDAQRRQAEANKQAQIAKQQEQQQEEQQRAQAVAQAQYLANQQAQQQARQAQSLALMRLGAQLMTGGSAQPPVPSAPSGMNQVIVNGTLWNCFTAGGVTNCSH